VGNIILVGHEKGGVGKTDTVISLAVALANEQYKGKTDRILLIDADKQLSLYSWVQRREEDPELNNFPCISLRDNIAAQVKREAEKYDYVFVDVAGRDSKEMRSAMTVADLLLSPTGASLADLETLTTLVENLESAQLINPTLKPLIFISKSNTRSQREKLESRELLKQYDEFKLLRITIDDRVSHRDSFRYGKGVHEWKDSKAKGEVSCLLKEVLDELR
jgi:chromosome partitioning protein